MKNIKIVAAFRKHRFHLRPETLVLIEEEFQNQQCTEQEFINIIVQTIYLIMEQKRMISVQNIEPEFIKEVFLLMKISPQDRLLNKEQKENHNFDIFRRSIIFKNIFEKKGGDTDFARQKFISVQKTLKMSQDFYFSDDIGKYISKDAYRVINVGSLKGKEGIHCVLGLLFERKGKFYLQDLINEVRVVFELEEDPRQFVFNGSIMLVVGEMDQSMFKIFQVLQVPYINLRQESLKQTYKDIFFKQLEKNMVEPEIIKDEAQSYMSFFSNFTFSKKNFLQLFSYVTDKQIKDLYPTAIFLMGNFFGIEKVNSEEKNTAVLKKIQRFNDFLANQKDFFKNVKVFLVPDVDDLGLNTFPRKQLPCFLFRDLIEAYPNVHLAQNPSCFCFLEKTFYVQRFNMIDKAVRNSLQKPSEEVATFQLMSNTLIQQRDFLPFNLSELTKLKEYQYASFYDELPDFTIFGDDFCSQNIFEVDSKKKIIYTSNFNLTSSYIDVYPLSGNIILQQTDFQ